MKVFARQIISQCPTESVAPHTLSALLHCGLKTTQAFPCVLRDQIFNYWSVTQALSQEFIQSSPSFHPYWYGNAGVSAASNRNEDNKVRIYQTKRFTSNKIFWAFLYKIDKFHSRKGLKSKPAWEAEGHLCIQMSKALMFWTSLVLFTLIIASVQSDSEPFTIAAM